MAALALARPLTLFFKRDAVPKVSASSFLTEEKSSLHSCVDFSFTSPAMQDPQSGLGQESLSGFLQEGYFLPKEALLIWGGFGLEDKTENPHFT